MAGASSGLAGRASPLLWLVLLLLRGGRALQGHQGHQGHQGRSCRQDDVTFELITGFVYSAPKDVLDTRTGTLKLSDCIAACQEHANCQSLNFETGLCVLFSSSAETHPGKRLHLSDTAPKQGDGLELFVTASIDMLLR